MKIFLLFLSLVFLIGCAGLNPYSRQLKDLHTLYEQDQISAESYVAYKMHLTRQEFLWNQRFFNSLSELSEPAESEIIYYQPLKLNTEGLPSSLNKKKYRGTIRPYPYTGEEYEIEIQETP